MDPENPANANGQQPESTPAPLRPEARKRPPSDHVSLHTGWLLTLSSTPV